MATKLVLDTNAVYHLFEIRENNTGDCFKAEVEHIKKCGCEFVYSDVLLAEVYTSNWKNNQAKLLKFREEVMKGKRPDLLFLAGGNGIVEKFVLPSTPHRELFSKATVARFIKFRATYEGRLYSCLMMYIIMAVIEGFADDEFKSDQKKRDQFINCCEQLLRGNFTTIRDTAINALEIAIRNGEDGNKTSKRIFRNTFYYLAFAIKLHHEAVIGNGCCALPADFDLAVFEKTRKDPFVKRFGKFALQKKSLNVTQKNPQWLLNATTPYLGMLKAKLNGANTADLYYQLLMDKFFSKKRIPEKNDMGDMLIGTINELVISFEDLVQEFFAIHNTRSNKLYKAVVSRDLVAISDIFPKQT